MSVLAGINIICTQGIDAVIKELNKLYKREGLEYFNRDTTNLDDVHKRDRFNEAIADAKHESNVAFRNAFTVIPLNLLYFNFG